MSAGISYDVYVYESYDARRAKDLTKARLVGTADNFDELTVLGDDNPGPIGLTKRETKEIVSYEDAMVSWGEEPWSEKAIAQIVSR